MKVYFQIDMTIEILLILLKYNRQQSVSMTRLLFCDNTLLIVTTVMKVELPRQQQSVELSY